MDNITNKRILFFCTSFFSYYIYIKRELEELGANCVRFVECPNFDGSPRKFNSYDRSLAFLYFYFKDPKYRTNWTNSLLDSLQNEKFDVLFCVADVPFKKFFLDEIRKRNPNIRTYLFLWDRLSVRRIPLKIIESFDFKFSFDRDDCNKVKELQYLPDFYIEFDSELLPKEKYSVSLIATLTNVERGVIAKSLKTFCDENQLDSFIYLLASADSNPTGNIFKKIYRNVKNMKKKTLINRFEQESFFKSKPLSVRQVNEIQQESKCIFDFGYKGRQGLTLNSIAALAKGKKLITSNTRIVEESFYNPNNIFIYDYRNPQFDIDFFKRPVEFVDMSYLRLDNWLKYILNR